MICPPNRVLNSYRPRRSLPVDAASPSHRFMLQEERRSMRPLLGRRRAVHVDALVTEHGGDDARDRLSVDFGEHQARIIAKNAQEVPIVVGGMNDEVVARGCIPQHFVEPTVRVIRMLNDARGHSSPHRQTHVVASFRMHLIHERLVVQEVDLHRSSRLDRLRTWFELQTLMWVIWQRPVRLYDDGQGPTPSRHLVDASPELANRIRVVVWPSWPPRNVTDAHAGFASE